MSRLGIYLKLLRVHTACLTMAGAMLGAVVAGERNPLILFLFALWSFLYHGWGFIQNNLFDVEYDRKDPAKQHFPLVNGSMSVRRAWMVDHLFFLLMLVLGLYMFMLKRNLLAMVFLFGSMGFGTLYNKYSKRTLLAPLFITAAFTAIPLFSFFAISSTLTLPILLIALYTVFLMLFQISVSGFLKDIGSDRVNLLRKFGTSVESGILMVSKNTDLYGWVLVYAKALTILVSLWVFGPEPLATLISGGCLIVVGYLSFKLLESGKFDNAKKVRQMSLIEIFSYLALVLVLQGLLGWILTLFFVIFPITWFVLMNRLTFGTLIRPRV